MKKIIFIIIITLTNMCTICLFCGCYQQGHSYYYPTSQTYTPKLSVDPKSYSKNKQVPQVDPEPVTNLDKYMKIINDSGLNTYISEVHQDNKTATIKVRDSWHFQHYQLRLQCAQKLWLIWASLVSPNDPDLAIIYLVDNNGNNVGGSGWLGGSVIKVQK